MLLPFVALLGSAFAPAGEHWDYVRRYQLPLYISETLILVFGSAALGLILGVALAWITTMHDFFGRGFFTAALVLPLAIPPYIAAYLYDGLLGYTGPVQRVWRNLLGMEVLPLHLPPRVWAVFIFGFTLFPYVYMLSRAFLRNQSAALVENGLLLGGGWRFFGRVGLPLLLPSAGAGALLVCLEVVNDFGLVSFYGLNTLSTAIFNAWFGMSDPDSAIRLAVILLAFVLLALLLRKILHQARKYRIVSSREKKFRPRRAGRVAQAVMLLFCVAVASLGFFLPLGQMLYWLCLSYSDAFSAELGRAALYTLAVGSAATVVIMAAATATVNADRLFGGGGAMLLSQTATLGYSIPSAVLAIGIITLCIRADTTLHSLAPGCSAMPFSMSSFMLLFAYTVRFFTIGYQAVETGFFKLGLIYTEASRTLGRNVTQSFFLVDLPLIRHALVSGAVLVFIDISKELPLSLILRPFNTETLGTSVYRFVNNEAMESIALPSLCIVTAGALCLLAMQRWEGGRDAHVSAD